MHARLGFNTAYRSYDKPPMAPAPAPLRFPDLRGEWRIGREALRLALNAPGLLASPRGRRQPVILIPGWQAPQASMNPLRQLLRLKGYDARHWGQGVNRGDVEAYVDKLRPVLERLAERREQPVSLIGWSLGGVIARELAREMPALVRTVVTYGSPVQGGPIYTAAARSYSAPERERIRRLIEERNRDQPIKVPMAVIFSRLDTIVSWPACIDRLSPSVTHYEVDSTHFSMGIDPAVWQIVLERLRG